MQFAVVCTFCAMSGQHLSAPMSVLNRICFSPTIFRTYYLVGFRGLATISARKHFGNAVAGNGCFVVAALTSAVTERSVSPRERRRYENQRIQERGSQSEEAEVIITQVPPGAGTASPVESQATTGRSSRASRQREDSTCKKAGCLIWNRLLQWSQH